MTGSNFNTREPAASARAKWSSKEISDLHSMYADRPWDEIIKATNKSKEQIQKKAFKEGLSRALSKTGLLLKNMTDAEKTAVKRERNREATKKWRSANKDKIRARLERAEVKERNRVLQNARNSRDDVRKKRSECNSKPELREKRRINSARRIKAPEGMLSNRVSASIWRGLRRGVGFKAKSRALGYTLDELKWHIEKQFVRGMSWDNAGEWHIDHIIPLSSFRFSSTEDEEFLAAWALTNLRPMWALDNQRKSNKIQSLL